jgi:hypothetical protein
MPQERRPITSKKAFLPRDYEFYRSALSSPAGCSTASSRSGCAPDHAPGPVRRLQGSRLHRVGKKNPFVGSQSSDVRLLASRALPSDRYHQVDVGDVDGLVTALHEVKHAVIREREPWVLQRDGLCPAPAQTRHCSTQQQMQGYPPVLGGHSRRASGIERVPGPMPNRAAGERRVN